MKKAGVVLTVILALMALGVGFAGTTAVLYVTQPASNSTTTVRFIVNQGDSTLVVAQHLQDDGLIRSALAFRLYARFEHLDQGIEPGVYLLRPNMSMKKIIAALQVGKPDEQLAGVPDGLRLTQYPPYFSSLPNFSASDFASIAKTATLPDGTQLWKKYWFVQQPPSPKAKVKVFDALEGYLYPDHFYFNNSDDTVAVVEKMLLELGSQFCPGPAGNPDQYVDTLADCKAHPAMIGNTSIFTSMESAYHTKNDTLAIYDTLIIASLTAREISNYNDAIGVASVYHNRYLYSINAITNDGGTAGYMGSDPSAEYARDSDTPPKDGKWWTTLGNAGKNIDPNNPYNTEAPPHTGLPPGPIANPVSQEILAAAAPKDPTAWPYFYFVSDKSGKILYAKDPTGFCTIVQQAGVGSC
jgi:UPF0755 protein